MKLPIHYTKDSRILLEGVTMTEQQIDESVPIFRRFFGASTYAIPDTPINQYIFDNVGSNIPLESAIEFVLNAIKDKKTYCHLNNHFMIDGTEITDGDPSQYGEISVLHFALCKKNIAEEIADRIVRTCKSHATVNELLDNMDFHAYSLLVEARISMCHNFNCSHCGQLTQFIYDIGTGKITDEFQGKPCEHDYGACHDHLEFDIDFPSGKVLVINGIRDVLSGKEEDQLLGYHSVNSTKGMRDYILAAAQKSVGECFLHECYPDIFYRQDGFKMVYKEDLESIPDYPGKLEIDIERNWVTLIDLDTLKAIKPDADLEDFEEQIIDVEPGTYRFKLNMSQQPEVPVIIEKK